MSHVACNTIRRFSAVHQSIGDAWTLLRCLHQPLHMEFIRVIRRDVVRPNKSMISRCSPGKSRNRSPSRRRKISPASTFTWDFAYCSCRSRVLRCSQEVRSCRSLLRSHTSTVSLRILPMKGFDSFRSILSIRFCCRRKVAAACSVVSLPTMTNSLAPDSISVSTLTPSARGLSGNRLPKSRSVK